MLNESETYRPFKYAWAHNYAALQNSMHWVPDEANLHGDVRDWVTMDASDKEFLLHTLRFFTQADADVAAGYVNNYLPLFKNNEIRMMLLSFSNMEVIHMMAYAKLMDTLELGDGEFGVFKQYKEMVDKHEFALKFSMSDINTTLETMAVYGAFTEGMQLFVLFIILLNYARSDNGKVSRMQGMADIVRWSVRDESLHTEGIIKLFHEFAGENGGCKPHVQNNIRDIGKQMVEIEENFIHLLYSKGTHQGLDIYDLIRYLHFICDTRLDQLKIKRIYHKQDEMLVNPLPWVALSLGGVELANFFETRSTAYSKGSSTGSFKEAWEVWEEYKKLYVNN